MRVLLVESKWYRPALPAVQNPAKRLSGQPARRRVRWGHMPDPIQVSSSSSSIPIDGASAEETSGQVCLSPTVPNASLSQVTVPPSPPSVSPAVSSLVARFSPPNGSHPPVAPSLGKALENCGWEVAGAALAVGTALLTPAGLATTLLTGARGVVGLGSAERCIERDEARQVSEGETANQAADCARDGAIPLLKADGSVICARP